MVCTARPAQESDVPEILELVRALASYNGENPDAVQNTVPALRNHLFGEQPTVFAHVVEAREESTYRLDGVALWFLNYSTWTGTHGIYLEDLYVRDQARGCGAGTALLKSLADVAVARGYARVEWAVLAWNESASQFYRALGARPLQDWSTYRLSGDALTSLAGTGAPTKEKA